MGGKTFFTYYNARKSLTCILTKFGLFTSFRFQDIAVQSQQFSPYFRVAILPILLQKTTFWKVCLKLLEKRVIYNSNLFVCFDNNFTTKQSLRVINIQKLFKILFVVGNPGKTFKGKSKLLYLADGRS